MSTRAENRPVPGTWLATCNLRGGPDALSLRSATPDGTAQSAETPVVQVIFSGLLYNREELSKVLEVAPEPTEALLVARAYERWGEGFPGKLKGIFATALWDRERRSLLCARDPMGIYPLYYAETDRGVVVSTSVDELVGHPAVSRELNRAALADHLLHRWPNLEETLYRHVRRVFPGHLLRQTGSVRRTARYWDPIPLGRPMNWIRKEELGRFDELFSRAVRRCLSFGPAGIFLSGGLDSVSAAAVAVDESRRLGLPSPWALSLVFPDPECDEEAVQREAAQALGLPQQFLSFDEATDGRWFRAAVEMSAGWPMPLLNTWNPAYFNLASKGRQRGCAVILTGTGGDEWLGVTPFLAADLIRAADFRGFLDLFRAQRLSFRIPSAQLIKNLAWRFGLRPLMRDFVLRFPGGRLAQRVVRRLRGDRRREVPDWVAPDPILRRELASRDFHSREENHCPSYYLREVRSGFDHLLTAWEMEDYFENSRRLGVWILHPFQDPDLVEFLCRTPPLWLNRGGRSKGLVREWLAGRVPQSGFETQKKVHATGFFRARVFAEARAAWGEVGGLPALAGLGVVDQQRVEQAFEQIVSKRPAEAYRIWDMLSVEAWVRPRC